MFVLPSGSQVWHKVARCPKMEKKHVTDGLMMDSSACGQSDIRRPSKNALTETRGPISYIFFN